MEDTKEQTTTNDDSTDMDDKVLEQVLGAEPKEPEPSKAPAPVEDADDEQPDEGADESSEPDGESDELTSAREFLQREKLIPQEVIEQMTDEQLLKAGKEAQERIAERTRLWQRTKELEKEAPVKAEEPSQEVGHPFDLDKWAQPFEDELGGDAAGRLKELATHLLERLDVIQSRADQAFEIQVRAMEQSARQVVGERFPDVLDPVRFSEKMEPAVQKLVKTGDYEPTGEGLQRLLEDAARLVGFEEKADKPKRTTRKQRRGGLPSHNGKRTVQVLDPANLDEEIAKAILHGDEDRLKELRHAARTL